MKKRYLAGVVLSILFTYLVFRQIDIQSFLDAMKEANYLYVLPVALWSMVGFFFRTWRWQYFLRPLKSIPFERVWSATIIGYMGLNILPMRIGELARPYAIGMLAGVSKSSALATVVVERILDLLFLMVFFIIVLLGMDLPHWFIEGSYVIAAFVAAVIVFLLFLFFQEKRAIGLIEVLSRRLPAVIAEKAKHVLESFICGLHGFKETKNYKAILILTVLMWGGYTLSVYCGFYAFNLVERYDLTLFSALVVIVFTTMGFMIPSTPGSFGTFHWFCQEGMFFMNVPREEALGYSVLIHAVSFILLSVLGIIYLWKENIRLIDIQKGDKAEQT